jgi:hypothetical protein
MTRTIFVALGAAVLSFVLLALSVVAWVSWTRSGHFARDQQVVNKDYATVQREYGDPFQLLNRGKQGYELLVFPLISIIIGVAVGLIGRAHTGWTAVVALLPLQIFLLAADGFAVGAFMRALVYFLLVYFSASKVQSMRASPPRTASTTA